MKPTVGFVGLGVIGLPMAERLLERQLPLAVWNRTAEKAEALTRRGAQRAKALRELAALSDIVITVVTDGPALEEVSLGTDGIAAGLMPGKVHCDMSTIDLKTSRRMAAEYAGHGLCFLHAPVLGNRHRAAEGTLLIFAGGPRAGFEKCEPVFAALGRKTWHWERPETATCVKLACNLLLGGMMEIFSESLVFAAKAGVAADTLLEIFGASALAAPMYASKGRAIVARDFAPNFYLRNMRKDFDLILEAAGQLGVALPATPAIREVFAAAEMAGKADLDYSAVVEWLEEKSSTRVASA